MKTPTEAQLVAADPRELAALLGRVRRAFLTRCDKLATRSDRTVGAVSFSIFNDGSRLGEIAKGGEIGVGRLERALCTLADLEAAPHPEAAKAKAKTRR